MNRARSPCVIRTPRNGVAEPRRVRSGCRPLDQRRRRQPDWWRAGRAHRYRHIYEVWFRAFPDLTFTTEDLIVDDERVALLGRASGTHLGEFFGMSATSRRIELACVFIYRMEDGLIAHERRVLDFTGLLVQVGVLRAKPA